MADDRTFYAFLPAGQSLKAAVPAGTKASCIRSAVDIATQDRIIEKAPRRYASGQTDHYFTRVLSPLEREAYGAAQAVTDTFPGAALGACYQGPCRRCGMPLHKGHSFCSRNCSGGGVTHIWVSGSPQQRRKKVHHGT